MADFMTVAKNLEDRGFEVTMFATAAEAAAYLDNVIDGVTVGIGGSLTVKELGSTHYGTDETVYLGFNPNKVNVFENTSEKLIKYCV